MSYLSSGKRGLHLGCSSELAVCVLKWKLARRHLPVFLVCALKQCSERPSLCLCVQSVAYPSNFDVEGGEKLPEVNAALPAFSGVEGLKEVKETTSSP